MPKKSDNWSAIGRRKSSIARVKMESGKGVFIIKTKFEAKKVLNDLMKKKKFGASGKEVVEDYREATYNELKISLNKDCSNCLRVDFEDCEKVSAGKSRFL